MLDTGEDSEVVENERKGRRAPWLAVGLVVGLVAAWGGSGLVGAATSAPTSITTCTKASTSKTKVIVPSAAAKCTSKGKGFAKSWSDSRYQQLLKDIENGDPTVSYAGIDLSRSALPSNFQNFDFTGANFFLGELSSGEIAFSNFSGANLQSATLTNATFYADNFNGADLRLASLQGSDFSSSEMSGAIFGTTVNDSTTCPNGLPSYEHPGCLGQGGGL